MAGHFPNSHDLLLEALFVCTRTQKARPPEEVPHGSRARIESVDGCSNSRAEQDHENSQYSLTRPLLDNLTL